MGNVLLCFREKEPTFEMPLFNLEDENLKKGDYFIES
jgi:hypothetical protein